MIAATTFGSRAGEQISPQTDGSVGPGQSIEPALQANGNYGP